LDPPFVGVTAVSSMSLSDNPAIGQDELDPLSAHIISDEPQAPFAQNRWDYLAQPRMAFMYTLSEVSTGIDSACKPCREIAARRNASRRSDPDACVGED
jgi:hypothetical protein